MVSSTMVSSAMVSCAMVSLIIRWPRHSSSTGIGG
jgi:hypothetical protein